MSNSPPHLTPSINLPEIVENANPTGLKVAGVSEVERPFLVGDFIESCNAEALERDFTFHLRDGRVAIVVGRDLQYLADENQPETECYAVIAGSPGHERMVAQFFVKDVTGVSTGEIRSTVN